MNGFDLRNSSGLCRLLAHSRTSLLVGALVLGGLAGCAGSVPGDEPAAEPVAAVPAGAVRGEVVRYVLTMESGEMEEHFYLRTSATLPEQRLFFAQPRNLEAGTTVDVWGDSTADGIQVQRLDLVAPVAHATESNAQALITDQPLKPRRFAFVLVDLGAGVRLTKAEAEKKLFGVAAGDKSVRQYFIEASYGRQDIGGEVFGPIKGTMTGCNFPNLATSLRGQVPTGFDHYLWYFGSRVASCGFAGVALSGTPARVQRDTWYNAASDCVVLVQEPAHNFGTMHSSSMKCRNNLPFADAPQGTCAHNEYGDPYDPMGRACRHMNGYQKAFQGWFGGCNVVDVNASGTFTLLPLETPCDGTQVLQIKMPKARPFAHSGGGGGAGTTDITHYYLEYRAPIGFDTGLTPVVQIRVSGDIRARTQRGFNTWLLDMNPATPVIEGLVAGGTYTDPAGGIKVTVVSIDGKQAVVKVENPAGTGASTCMDGKPLPSPAPGPESCSAMVATPSGAPPAFPADGGTTPPMPPSDAGAGTGGTTGGTPGTGGSPSGTAGSSGGGLVPITVDAGTSEGFKDSGSPGTSEPSGAGGRGGSSGGSSSSGGTSGSAPVTTSGGKTGGCSMGGGNAGGGLSAFGLLALGLLVTRRRRR